MRKPNAYTRHAAGLPTALVSPQPMSPRSAALHHGGPGGAFAGLFGGGRRGAIIADAVAVLGALWALLATAYVMHQLWPSGGGSAMDQAYALEPVLISYSYFEKDPVQVANFEFFLAAGTQHPPRHTDMHWAIVVSGENCSPCQGLYGILRNRETADLRDWGIKEAWHDPKFSLILRSDNVGMDLGAHNATLEYFSYLRLLGRYKYFVFLNSSVKGPFYPPWVPPGWHWTHAYLARMGREVHAVGSSLVCLPEADAGGPGPRLESWAFALDQDGLGAALEAGVFVTRTCKLCTDGDQGIVVGGEYRLTQAQFEEGYNVATLMARYAPGTDWRDEANWGCNDNVHPSRAGTYGGISFHPYETVFVKSSWHVADPYTKRYSQWALQHLLGKPGTEGQFNEKLYAISEEAQRPRDLEEAYHPKLKTGAVR
ncbi:hypothetical protein MNEG_0542 [Monoraphidium neglectum]|uniref:Uncharacterized protein n=1 Tax=Monoraphidium neglectum TaxID=145388 RepID=A0A0D2NT69_9CHLO|nr:hypothetical protein MNEG_0542 [Monoraphidium neglectum]KIZ07406.1 hypothetical protein MNEG_0542 [Monoraphidium neglectum]|eukprot:XP_013906425.1 hypothetical protein MNEG_0542 [Monoraphidium neglectum]